MKFIFLVAQGSQDPDHQHLQGWTYPGRSTLDATSKRHYLLWYLRKARHRVPVSTRRHSRIGSEPRCGDALLFLKGREKKVLRWYGIPSARNSALLAAALCSQPKADSSLAGPNAVNKAYGDPPPSGHLRPKNARQDCSKTQSRTLLHSRLSREGRLTHTNVA